LNESTQVPNHQQDRRYHAALPAGERLLEA
jgi:hypothetical protein